MGWNGSGHSIQAHQGESQPRGWHSRFNRQSLVLLITVTACIGLYSYKFMLNAGKPEQPVVEQKIPKVATTSYHKNIKVVQSKASLNERLSTIGELKRAEVHVAESPIDISTYTNHYFETGVEQVMGWIFACQPGMMAPLLPAITDEEKRNIAAILISKSVIKPTDDDKAIAVKQAVNQAKKEMMRFIKEGGDPQEFLEYYHEQLRMASNFRDIAFVQVQEAYEEDPELGRELLSKVNEKLDSEGIVTISESEIE